LIVAAAASHYSADRMRAHPGSWDYEAKRDEFDEKP